MLTEIQFTLIELHIVFAVTIFFYYLLLKSITLITLIIFPLSNYSFNTVLFSSSHNFFIAYWITIYKKLIFKYLTSEKQFSWGRNIKNMYFTLGYEVVFVADQIEVQLLNFLYLLRMLDIPQIDLCGVSERLRALQRCTVKQIVSLNVGDDWINVIERQCLFP